MVACVGISVDPLMLWLGCQYFCRLLCLFWLLLLLVLSRPLLNLKQKKVVENLCSVIKLAKYELIQNKDQIVSKMGPLAENAGHTSMSHYKLAYLYDHDYG